MAPTGVCPKAPELELLLQGKLAPEQSDAYLGHVEQCPACADTVEQLLAADSFVSAVRDSSALAPAPLSAPVGDLIRRVRQLHGAALTPPPTASATCGGSPADEDMAAVLAPPQAADEIGRVGGYRILKKLGAGGMGVVYLAEDVGLRRQVALKVMLPALARRESARRRFLTEARAVAAVEHENIVAIHQVGEDRGIPFLAMPLLKGMSLEEHLGNGRTLPVAEVLGLGRQIALGLAAAHERGLVHRDVKPANIWIEPDGRVKLLDFGLARAQGPDRESGEAKPLTEPGTLIGTPAYMAPEQARGLPVDGRADLFSLGCVLYRMCTGKAPFAGQDVLVVLLAIAGDEPPPVATVNPAVPAALSELIRRLLAKDPAQRPASAREVAQRLEALPGTTPRGAAGAEGRRKWTILQRAVAAMLLVVTGALMAGIVVLIKDSTGKTVAKIQMPDGGSVVTEEGNKGDQVGGVKRTWPPAPKEIATIDPGILYTFAGRTGTRATLRVIGAVGGFVWGTDLYSLDSNLATAAVHAGALKEGQTGILEIEIVASPQGFTGSTANGVTSHPYGFLFPPGAFVIKGVSIDKGQGKGSAFLLPDPGTLSPLAGQIGTKLALRVTGGFGGPVYGSGPYTLDSSLAEAAVHAGVLQVGQTGNVEVEIIASPPGFSGSIANGVTSYLWVGPWPQGAFRIKGATVDKGPPVPLPNPGNLSLYAGQTGVKVPFRVTGALRGFVYGSGPYTLDSSLAGAAIHAGALKVGQTGIVEVEIVASPPGFKGSTANGITSIPWGAWPQGAFLIKGATVEKGPVNFPQAILPDPGDLSPFAGQTGAKVNIRVTGAPAGIVFGSGPYTLDSSLATAAVHAGVLKVGQTADVQVEIVASPPAFPGSTAHGIRTIPWPRPWLEGAFRIKGISGPGQGNGTPGPK